MFNDCDANRTPGRDRPSSDRNFVPAAHHGSNIVPHRRKHLSAKSPSALETVQQLLRLATGAGKQLTTGDRLQRQWATSGMPGSEVDR